MLPYSDVTEVSPTSTPDPEPVVPVTDEIIRPDVPLYRPVPAPPKPSFLKAHRGLIALVVIIIGTIVVINQARTLQEAKRYQQPLDITKVRPAVSN